eukprot:TRINITY_DN57777_c0_g1_i1.p1 TRINITY_DN57777_c0_g1~~TRINITY_DN57777_c0_g1_i1.p1  ORF type:complete len:502 (-),score=43.35 TRINITY_DN57777_c0_g1_i1:557-1948(-)
MVPTLIFGMLLSSAEAWDFVDALLYVGGDLVLLPLTNVAPVTPTGRFIAFVCSCVSLGTFSWLLALLGSLPVVAASKSLMDDVVTKKKGTDVYKEDEEALSGHVFLSLALFTFVVMPAVFNTCSFILGGLLALLEGTGFQTCYFFALSLMSHCQSFSPSSPPQTVAGRIFELLIAIYALAVSIGWVVGIYSLLPAMGVLTRWVSKFSKRMLHSDDSCRSHLVTFTVVVIVGVPCCMLPAVAVAGALFMALEGWQFLDGVLCVAGNIVLITLTSRIPVTSGGKFLDFVTSVVGVALFGFIVVLVGTLPFTDACADKLGGKHEGVCASIEFTLVFFLVPYPFVCALLSLPMGAVLAVSEGWGLLDGWLYVAGIVAQAPGLSPPSLQPASGGGKLVIFIVACWGMCISVGWGCGVIVASTGLNTASQNLSAWLEPEKRKNVDNAGTYHIVPSDDSPFANSALNGVS